LKLFNASANIVSGGLGLHTVMKVHMLSVPAPVQVISNRDIG